MGGGETVEDLMAYETRGAVRWIAWCWVHPGSNQELRVRLRNTWRRHRNTASWIDLVSKHWGCTDTSTLGVGKGCRPALRQQKLGDQCARISHETMVNATLPNDRGLGNGSVTMLSDTRGINELVRRAGIGSGLLPAPSVHITGPTLGMGSDGMLLLGRILA